MLHNVILLQDILLTCQVQSIQNHGRGGDSVVKFSYLQLTCHSGQSARNFAALVFWPEV